MFTSLRSIQHMESVFFTGWMGFPHSFHCLGPTVIRIRIRIYLLAGRNLLWDILRLPSSRRAALGLYVILTLWRGRGANQPPYALLHRSSPRYALRHGRRLLKDYYCIDVKVVFSSFKVKNYFSLKCHTPMPLMANVVYQFTCLRDANSTYIGKTIRHLATRVKEHATSSSAIKEHLSSCTTCKDNNSCNSFKVIDSANSDFEVSIKEALHIKHRNPNLNKQLSTQGMSFMLKIFT